ncbi:MAG TPA: UDP-3-O-(3-hydroxymyristoyl)glucosamine N-acyltransferase [candidate division Zixibacteria bacterium]|nr:UDP-3-O-(3-hydroxymyristoyl)glucosamine N-acyltransferase [candidate division Zixibacteria bacterium]
MKLSNLAAALKLTLENASSDPEITGVATLEDATPNQISFFTNARYAEQMKSTRAAAVIVEKKWTGNRTVLRSDNPYLDFARTLEMFYQPPQYAPGIHPTAVIDPSARIGARAHIGPYVVVDADVVIGEDAVLLAHVMIYRGARIGNRFFAHSGSTVREYCQLGDNVILQNGVIIGADGFGFAREGSHWHKIVQSGRTVLGDWVEVQANATVDRATIGETRVDREVKIDNFVQVGHGSTVGEGTMLCSQTGLSGSTHVGKNVILAGQVGVAGHCTIGDGAIATAQTGIPNDVPAGAIVSGYPAIDNKQWLRSVAVFNKLPELARAIRKLSRQDRED